jgi:hypothetical protein
MNWDAIGAVGEWIGGLATIGTLFYLAHQVRASTRATRSSAYQHAVSAISDWTNIVSTDPQVSKNLSTAMADPDALDPNARAQVGLQLNSLFRNYENIFYQWREGAIGDDVWEGWREQICAIFWTKGTQSWWPTWENYCHAEFRRFLESSDSSEVKLVLWEQSRDV